MSTSHPPQPLMHAPRTERLSEPEGMTSLRQAFARGNLQDVVHAVSVLRGDFAVHLHDDLTQRSLIAVDRFAIQTICYRLDGGHLIAAQRADAMAEASTPLAPQALFDYLYFHAIPSPCTVFSGVRRLPPGHWAWHQGHAQDATAPALQTGRYWSPTFAEQPTSFAAAREQFRALLRQAVAAQLDGTRPACFLSGGTDSSTIAGMIRDVTGQAPATYSIGFEAEGYDEMEYARLAARHFSTDHHEYYVTPGDLAVTIPDMAAYLDQPFGNSSALPAAICAQRARHDGVTRLLAGDGGDELFGGNTRYATQRVFAWYDKLPAALRRSLIEPAVDAGTFDKVPLLRKGASYVRQARVPMPDRLQTYNLLRRLGQAEVLTPGFLAAVDADGPRKHQAAVWAESNGADFVNRMLAYDWRYTLGEIDLPKVRAATQLAGVSVGYPFLDKALLEFSSSLPVDFKLKGLKLRWFFKEALRGFLPERIIAKKKHGFGLPFGIWVTRHDGLRALAQDSVRGLGERGIVRREFTTVLMSRHLPQHPGYYGEMVWILMMLEQWLRHHAPNYRFGD